MKVYKIKITDFSYDEMTITHKPLKHKTILLHYFKNLKFASYQKFVKSKAIYHYDITRDSSKIFRLFSK